jgi:Flp pilus assembly protein TadD
MQRCLDLFHLGRIGEAAQVAREAVRAFPDDGELWQLHGLLGQHQGDIEGACAALETAGLLVPLNPAAQCALADCHARAGRRELARELYRALAGNRSCPTALLPAVASGLGCLGDAPAALDVCRELARRKPYHHEAYFGMAYYTRQAGGEAAEVFPLVARAHELSPKHPVYRVVMACFLARSGRYDEACALLRGVRPEAVRCEGCVRRIMDILDRGGAEDVVADFRALPAQGARSLPEADG